LLTVIVRDVVTTLTREEREQTVLDLYNQGKTIREIAKEARMSFRDIGSIRKKGEEKEKQSKQLASAEGDNSQANKSSSTQAYELFSQDKTPLEVAVELDLSEKQVTRYYREYWKLKGLHKLTVVYEEIKDDIGYFLKLYRSSKTAWMSTDSDLTIGHNIVTSSV
jgi:DNA-binding CsgD family transcriptional regulator